MTTLVLTPKKWHTIKSELEQEYPKSVFLIKRRMKSILGFTVREHRGYRPRTQDELNRYDQSDHARYEFETERRYFRENIHEHTICLDFYNEKKYTMFLFKFSELINARPNLGLH